MTRGFQGGGSGATTFPGPRRVDRGGSTRAHTENTSCGGLKNLRIYTSGDYLPFSHLAHSVQRKKWHFMENGNIQGKKFYQKNLLFSGKKNHQMSASSSGHLFQRNLCSSNGYINGYLNFGGYSPSGYIPQKNLYSSNGYLSWKSGPFSNGGLNGSVNSGGVIGYALKGRRPSVYGKYYFRKDLDFSFGQGNLSIAEDTVNGYTGGAVYGSPKSGKDSTTKEVLQKCLHASGGRANGGSYLEKEDGCSRTSNGCTDGQSQSRRRHGGRASPRELTIAQGKEDDQGFAGTRNIWRTKKERLVQEKKSGSQAIRGGARSYR